MHSQREHEHEPSETPEPGSPEIDPRHFLSVEMHTDADSTHSRLMAASTVSAPEVSVMPSPEVLSKVCIVQLVLSLLQTWVDIILWSVTINKINLTALIIVQGLK